MIRFYSSVHVESVIDNLPSAVIVFDRDILILLANEMATQIANRTKDQFPGLRGGEAFNCVHSKDVPEGCGHGPECRHCTVKATVERSFRARSNLMMVEAEMEFLNLGRRNLRLSAIYLAENDAVILVIEDITDLKTAENERLERNKLIAAIETAGAVCHEMNQPLQVISGYLDIMLLKKELNGFNPNQLTKMREQLDRLGRITESLQHLKSFRSKEYLCGTEILDIERSSLAD